RSAASSRRGTIGGTLSIAPRRFGGLVSARIVQRKPARCSVSAAMQPAGPSPRITASPVVPLISRCSAYFPLLPVGVLAGGRVIRCVADRARHQIVGAVEAALHLDPVPGGPPQPPVARRAGTRHGAG